MKNNTLLRHPLATAIFIASSSLATNAIAEPIVWTGATSNDWSEGTNWVDDVPPTGTDDALVNNDGTVTVVDASAAAEVNDLTIGQNGSDGHFQILDNSITANKIVFGANEGKTGASNTSFSATNATITTTEKIQLVNDFVSGNSSFSLDFNNVVLDTKGLSHGLYTASGEISHFTSSIIFQDVTSTSTRALELGGDMRLESNAINTEAYVNNIIGIYDSNLFSEDSDLEIGSDVFIGRESVNNTLEVYTTAIIERSTLNFDYLEFGEYTGTLGWDDESGQGNTLLNNVDATITDSIMNISSRVKIGDVFASGDSDTHIVGDVTVTLNNSVLNVEKEIELTDMGSRDEAMGEDRALLIANDSTINLGDHLLIASDGSFYSTGDTILDAKVSLNNSALNVGRLIQIADLARRFENENSIFGASNSLVGKLTAFNSTISAEQIVVGSYPGVATLRLDQSHLSVTDLLDSEDPTDAEILESTEGALTFSADSLLKIDFGGYTRASKDNAINGSNLYGAIDAIQVTLAGTLQLNAGDGMNDDGVFDIIRAEKVAGVTLGEGAFTGIQGNFDEVIVKNLPTFGTATTSIVTETIDGKTYDIYRVEVGSMSFFSFAFMMMLGGMRRFRK